MISISMSLVTSLQNVVQNIIHTIRGAPGRGYTGKNNHCHSVSARWIRDNPHSEARIVFCGQQAGELDSNVFHSFIATKEMKPLADSLQGHVEGNTYFYNEHGVERAIPIIGKYNTLDMAKMAGVS